ncbi:disulfide bond formation protein B [Advenella sp. RU8]|uniref:disulfide bond formation protein B n=1 Tax=Advenella sp. RU8 TaxID=3399575 RepID=UPI003AAD6C89
MTQKILNLIAFLCLAAVGIALFSQHVLDMAPCAWCVLQRLIFLCIAAVCLLANFFSSAVAKKILALASAGLGVSGVLAAWYQYSVAAEMFSCDMTFADRFIARTTGLDAAVPWLFGIYASCMDARVIFFGVEYAIWSLILFVVIIMMSLAVLFTKNNTAK